MDGMEWKRRKWGWLARRYLKMAERLAVKWSDHLVTDHPVIQAYYARTYGIEPYCIPYGTKHHEEFKLAGFRDVPLFRKLGIRGNDYLLMIARLEPENNHDMIFEGYLNAGMAEPLLVVGDTGTKFGRRMYREFRSHKGIRFMGPVFDDGMLARLRHYCRAYIHGHSVGGTNPSLLDAMRAGCLILSHGNEYNRAVLGENGMYFSNSEQLAELLGDLNGHMERKKKWASANIRQTDRLYHWNEITRHYSRLFIKTGG
jgi:glycosyltransferase involved in cell wall biosynthesis